MPNPFAWFAAICGAIITSLLAVGAWRNRRAQAILFLVMTGAELIIGLAAWWGPSP
jgi:hypothetical protein